MTDDKPAYIAANSYTVSKSLGMSVGSPPLVFKDPNGNVLLTAKQGGLGRQSVLVDQTGKQVGQISKKGMSFGSKATYEFFGDGGSKIGQITIKGSLMGMSESVTMEDPNGNAAASASGNFSGFEFVVTDPSGQKTIAKISRNTSNQPQSGDSPGLKGMLGSLAAEAKGMMTGSYKIDILDPTINDLSRLYILELVVVLDTMYHPQQGGFGMGVGGVRI